MKKIILLLIPMLIILTGCFSEAQQPITPESTGLWNQFLIAVSYILIWLADLFNNSLTAAIIVLTIIIRIIIFPLYKNQLDSMAKNAELQPELKKIQEKYKNDRAKLAQEQSALFKRHGFNPLAGCLPMFLQIFIIFIFYQTITRLVIGDGVVTGLEAFGATNISTVTLFGADIALPSPFWAIASGITMYFSTKLTQIANPPSSSNQMAGQIQKMMGLVFPIMIIVFGFVLPAALTIYWTISNLIMILQVFLTYRTQIINNMKRKN